MTTTPPPPTDEPSPETPDAGGAELARAASDLESLTDAYDECTGTLETLEATVDALLDDRSTRVLVLDADRRVTAVSRGMAALLGEGAPLLGRRVATVAPPSWSGLEAALDSLDVEDGWQALPVGDAGARLCLRRATGDDQSAVYLVRYEEAGA